MIYPGPHNKKKRKRFITLTYVVGILVIIIILLQFFAPHALSPITHIIARPFLFVKNMAGDNAGTLWETRRSKVALIEENNTLKQQLALSQARDIELDFYKKELAHIQTLYGRASSTEKHTLVRILSKPGFSPYDTIIIDMGVKDGIKEGDLVFADNTILIGEVSAVYAQTSVATLYSSPDHKVEVLIGPKALQASALGRGGGNFEIKLPRNSGVVETDSVVLARHPMYMFGAIGSISSNSTDSFDQILFTSPIDILELKFATVKSI